ncbi:MAG TPA: cyclic nucleotide-binding domain-containing protein [Polyangia bacterium]
MANTEKLAPRQLKRLLKDYAHALRADPGNLVLRLKLAFVLKELGRNDEAVEMYRNVAVAYAQEGRLVQAMAVCKGILELEPEHRDTQALLAELAETQGLRQQTGMIRIQDMEGRWLAVPARVANPDIIDESRVLLPPELPEPDTSPDALAAAVPLPIAPPGDLPPAPPMPPLAPMPPLCATPPQPAPPVRRSGEPDALPPLPGVPAALVPSFDPPRPPSDFFDPERTSAPQLEGGPSRWVQLGMTPLHDDSLPSALIRSQVANEAETMMARPGGAIRLHDSDLLEVAEPEVDDALDPFDSDEKQTLEALATPMPTRISVEVPPVPLLSALPKQAFVDLIAAAPLKREPAGSMILREGDAGDAFYIMVGGHVRVLKNQPSGPPVEVAQLGPGTFFGEFAVLSDRRRHASVEAMDEVELFEISRQLLDQLSGRYPDVARTLRRFYRERLVETLIATAPFFAPLGMPERAALASRLRARRYPANTDILVEGGRRGGLYLILLGEVRVMRRRADGLAVPVALLGEGSYFGEMSLLRGGAPPNATVTTTRDCEVVELPAQSFYEFVARHPELWDELKREADRREAQSAQLLSGEARQSKPEIYLV